MQGYRGAVGEGKALTRASAGASGSRLGSAAQDLLGASTTCERCCLLAPAAQHLRYRRMRDDLQSMRDKTTDLEIKVDRDINELKSSVEKAKNDTIKSVITILGTFSAIAFTISRFIQMGAGGS